MYSRAFLPFVLKCKRLSSIRLKVTSFAYKSILTFFLRAHFGIDFSKATLINLAPFSTTVPVKSLLRGYPVLIRTISPTLISVSIFSDLPNCTIWEPNCFPRYFPFTLLMALPNDSLFFGDRFFISLVINSISASLS